MHNFFVGFGMIAASFCAISAVWDAIRNKNEKWWFRLIEFVFAFLFLGITILLSAALR